MGFFKKRKARKLAKQNEKEALARKKAEAKNVKPVVEAKREEPVKPKPVVEKKVEQPKPVKKEIVIEKKVEQPKPEKKETVAPKEVKPIKYHVSQNKDPRNDNYRDWRVRRQGSQKTIKYFSTQKEAIEYAESLADSAGSSIVIHKMDGSIRKQDYKKKS